MDHRFCLDVQAQFMATLSPIFIFGPTAIGKTALAIALARQSNGVIINADSMQLYHDLWVVTARPSVDELKQAEHWGFGIIDASVRWSTKAWLDYAHRLVGRAHHQGRQPIFVGGTGLYHSVLTQGLSAIPEPPADVVDACKALSIEELRAALCVADPHSGHLQDRQRMIRALSVSQYSDKPFSHWVQQPLIGAIEGVTTFVLDPDREQLRARIDKRFDLMMQHGAVEEVQSLMTQGLPDDLPCMRAIGVPEITAWLSGHLTQKEAVAKAQASSRQYAKRQLTWSRNQMQSAIKLSVVEFNQQEMERNISHIFSFLD